MQDVKQIERRRLRLVIAIPTLVVLFTIAVGVLNYEVVDYYANKSDNLHLKSVLDHVATEILLFSSVISIVALAFGIGLAYSIIHPIRRMTETARSIATGDLSRKVEIPYADEIGELGKSFNTMIAYLNDLFQERNRYILESFSGGLVTTDIRGNITAMNSAAEKVLCSAAETAIGRNLLDLIKKWDEEGEFYEILRDIIELQRPTSSREILFTSPRQEVFSLSISTSLLKDKSGNPFGCVVNFRDLSALKSFHTQMQRADHLAAIGTFATGIAHEIRNPLSSIKGIAQLLAEDFQEGEKGRHYVSQIVKEVDRLEKVIRSILDFSQPEPTRPVPCDVNQLLAGALALCRSRFCASNNSNFGIRETYGILPRCKLQADKITQAFLNVILNAFEATPPQGTIILRTYFDERDKKGKPITIEIANTGSTIPEGEIERIFEPFYTTKENGTGLGLPIAYQIISYNQGTIEVRSLKDWTKFIMKFPAIEEH
jgi:two-component system sensor histidine kinase AtoS